uniref:Uncharacterized protein n=1 Tax=Rhizophora mucronata TaxID=61149 RepID=A0A2P2PC64_RHIMU
MTQPCASYSIIRYGCPVTFYVFLQFMCILFFNDMWSFFFLPSICACMLLEFRLDVFYICEM